ncbi:MAG: hypothetical protein HY360_02625 [Verrucomicrobia bacterium]|nr:hypothetical protein [Verrucomicrobiota bacterium]
MKKRCLVHLIIWLFAGLLGMNLCAAPEVLWKQDFGSAKVGPMFAGGVIVEEPFAKAGKSLQLEFAKEGALPSIATAKDMVLAGTGTLRVWVRGKGLNDVANGLRLTVTLDLSAAAQAGKQTAPGRRFQASGMVYGVRTNEKAYRMLPIYFEVGDEPAPYTLSIMATWQTQTGDRKPTVWIERLELEGHGASAPYISGLLRTRFMYAPGTPVQIAVTVVNPTKEAFAGRLAAEDVFGLDGRRKAAETAVSIAAGEKRVVDLAWKAAGPEAGHEVEFALLDQNGKEVDRDQISVGITKDGRILHLPAQDFESGKLSSDSNHYLLYVWPASHTESRNILARFLRDRDNRTGRFEFFSWSWSDLAGFIPPEDPYLGNFEHQWWLSLKEYKEQIAMMKATGTHVESYILGVWLGEAAYELYHKHPDWFIYSRNGEVADYDMETHARYARRHEFEFVQAAKPCMGAVMDPTRSEVRRWVADQIIRLGKEMGFEGVRWDVWWLNVAPGNYRLDGTEIAPTLEEADRLSAESIQAVKELVAKELPDLTWGYNCGSPEENKNNPLRLAEMCKGRAWMLDEMAYLYGDKTSPFHFWNAYSKRMIEWGDHIRQLGGIYNPFMFGRGFNPAQHVEVDWLHATIFQILAGSRASNSLYKNNAALAGDLPLLAFRFSDTFSGWNLRLQPENQTRITVEAPPTLWWKGSVFSNKSPEGKDQTIVHLVNSPVAAEVGENRDSKVRPPVLNVKVRCNAAAGRLPKKAWLVMAESPTPDVEPKVQAVPLSLTKAGGDTVSVTVPAVLYLKTVVFEF